MPGATDGELQAVADRLRAQLAALDDMINACGRVEKIKAGKRVIELDCLTPAAMAAIGGAVRWQLELRRAAIALDLARIEAAQNVLIGGAA